MAQAAAGGISKPVVRLLCGRVRGRLVRNQITDDARIGIHNHLIWVEDQVFLQRFQIVEIQRNQAGHGLIGRAVKLLAGQQIVPRTIHGTQPIG
ncbi:hypothetical protein D3C76_1352250 [compost metagenome]